MNWIDTCVLGTYLIGITLFGIRVGFRRNASSKQYFLANKSLGWGRAGFRSQESGDARAGCRCQV
jgi:Na+/proline symporter